ncbi:MAG: cellulase family glycosylhydrolase [Acidimicrobiales bacterium]
MEQGGPGTSRWPGPPKLAGGNVRLVHRLRHLLAIGSVIVAVATAGCQWPPHRGGGGGLVRPPLSAEGRWLVDRSGRVVLLRGVNMVQKSPPYHPAGAGFSEDDAAFIARQGFNVVRLGVDWGALMPQPGVIDRGYIDGLARSVRDLKRHRIFVVLDFHQDGYGPLTHGNGFPEWATLTDGLPNPPAVFPLYYVQNPALQRAFDNFWANRAGPDGVGLQDNFALAARAIAKQFAHEPAVVGYEAMNEPWPGTEWIPCLIGCPDLEDRLLVPFYTRFTRAVTGVDRDALVFYEPFVLFNFGQSDTSLPRIGRSGVLAPHVYALTPADGVGRRSDGRRRGTIRSTRLRGRVRGHVRSDDAAPTHRRARSGTPVLGLLGLQREHGGPPCAARGRQPATRCRGCSHPAVPRGHRRHTVGAGLRPRHEALHLHLRHDRSRPPATGHPSDVGDAPTVGLSRGLHGPGRRGTSRLPPVFGAARLAQRSRSG